MAKGKSAEWLTEDGLLILKGLARDGCSDKQIYERIGISKQNYCPLFLVYKPIYRRIASNVKEL